MASSTKNHWSFDDVVKGPSKIDLLEASYFNRDRVLDFTLKNEKQIFAQLLGLIPSSNLQFFVLILEHYVDQNNKKKVVIVYDTLSRKGRFESPSSVEELLSLKVI